MKEKMTSGEIAKQAGVSTKALRIYDEKGLLKPVGHSEGNYKLYDKSSLIILEKIFNSSSIRKFTKACAIISLPFLTK